MDDVIASIAYQGRARRYSSEPPLAYPWTEAFIVVSRANGALSTIYIPVIPLSVGSKLEHFNAFIFMCNPRRACTGGLRYLSCLHF